MAPASALASSFGISPAAAAGGGAQKSANLSLTDKRLAKKWQRPGSSWLVYGWGVHHLGSSSGGGRPWGRSAEPSQQLHHSVRWTRVASWAGSTARRLGEALARADSGLNSQCSVPESAVLAKRFSRVSVV